MKGRRSVLLLVFLGRSWLGCSGPPPAPPSPPPSEAPVAEAPDPAPPMSPAPPAVEPSPAAEPVIGPLTPVVAVEPLDPHAPAVHVDRELHLLSPDMPSCLEMVTACDAAGRCTGSPVDIPCGGITRVGRENLRCNCP